MFFWTQRVARLRVSLDTAGRGRTAISGQRLRVKLSPSNLCFSRPLKGWNFCVPIYPCYNYEIMSRLAKTCWLSMSPCCLTSFLLMVHTLYPYWMRMLEPSSLIIEVDHLWSWLLRGSSQLVSDKGCHPFLNGIGNSRQRRGLTNWSY